MRWEDDLNLERSMEWSYLFRMAAPVIITSTFRNISDAVSFFFLAKSSESTSLGVMAATAAIMRLFLNVLLAFPMQFASVMSRDNEEREGHLSKNIATALSISAISGVMISLVCFLSARELLLITGCPQLILEESVRYMQRCSVSMTAEALTASAVIILGYSGRIIASAFITSLGIVSRIVVAYITIVPGSMGINGVVTALTVSRVLCASVSLILLIRIIKKEKVFLRVDTARLMRAISAGFPAATHALLTGISYILMQSHINSFGVDVMTGAMAADTILALFVTPTAQGVRKTTHLIVRRLYVNGRFLLLSDLQNRSYEFGAAVASAAGAVTVLSGWLILSSLFEESETVIKTGFIIIVIFAATNFMNMLRISSCTSLIAIDYPVFPLLSDALIVFAIRTIWFTLVCRDLDEIWILYVCFPISWTASFIFHDAVLGLKTDSLSLKERYGQNKREVL